MAGSITIIGEPELRRKFREMPLRLQRKALRRGVTKAGRATVKAAKKECPKETGVLRASLGQRVFTFRDKSGVGAVVGVRKGTKKRSSKVGVVRGGRRGKRGFRKARKGETATSYRNPEKYLHLVLFGHRIAKGGTLKRVSTRKTAVSKRTGVAGGGTSSASVAPNNFLLRAAMKTRGVSIRIISGDVRQQLLSEAVKK